MNKLIERINELAGRKKQVGLSVDELEEQQNLYRQYLDIVKGNVKNSLDNAGYNSSNSALNLKKDGLQINPESLRKHN